MLLSSRGRRGGDYLAGTSWWRLSCGDVVVATILRGIELSPPVHEWCLPQFTSGVSPSSRVVSPPDVVVSPPVHEDVVVATILRGIEGGSVNKPKRSPAVTCAVAFVLLGSMLASVDGAVYLRAPPSRRNRKAIARSCRRSLCVCAAIYSRLRAQ